MFTGNFELTWINEIGIEYVMWFDKLQDLTEYVTKKIKSQIIR